MWYFCIGTSSTISRLSSLGTRHSKRNATHPLFLQKRKRFSGGCTTKTVHYILYMPVSWCNNPRHVTIPRGEKRNYLAENGLLGKIEFNSEMNAEDIRVEVCRVFSSPMGLSEVYIAQRKTVGFRFLQRTGAGSYGVPFVSKVFTLEIECQNLWFIQHIAPDFC